MVVADAQTHHGAGRMPDPSPVVGAKVAEATGIAFLHLPD